MLNTVYRILPITCLLSITTCQILQGIAKSTPQRKAAPTCFNKEYIIAAWWRFEQKKKLLQSQTKRSAAQTRRSNDAWLFGRFQDQVNGASLSND